MYQYGGYNNYGLGFSQSQGNDLIKVNGLEGAKAYQMHPNSRVALFDGNEDLMYIKTTDGAGFPDIQTYEYKKIQSTSSATPDYVSLKELEEFKKEIKEEVINDVKQLIQQNDAQATAGSNPESTECNE